MVKLLKYSWLIGVMLFLGGLLNDSMAQDPTAFLEGKITSSSGKKLSGATITVKKNGSVVKTVVTSSSGKYNGIELPMGFNYTLVVSFDGYLTKEIAIDSKTGYYEEDSPLEIPMDLPFQLDEKKPDVDYSPISNGFQIGKLSIDAATGGLAPDMGFINSQKSKYDKFFEKLEEEANKDEENFKKFVSEGDKAFQSGNYDQALTNYNKALEIKENDPAVGGKVTTTEQKIEQKKQFDQLVENGDAALNAENFDAAIAKYQEAKAKMPDDKNIDAKIKDAQDKKAAAEEGAVEAQYQEKMAEAKAAFDDKDYAYAKTLYQEAGNIKQDEKDPPIKVKECEDIIKKQLEEEQAFNELVAAGDKGMLDEDYDTSIEKYTAALEIKDDSRVASELEKAKDLKKKKEEEADAAAKQAEFDEMIASGNDKLGSEDFDAAIADYQDALGMDVDNATANAKIKEAQDAKQAKEDAEANAAKQAEFEELIASGDDKLGDEDFDNAISEYQKALDLGVDNATANTKIQEAQDAKQAKEDADANAAKQAEFEELIASGDGKLGDEDFDNAISEYQKALDLGVDNATANAKIQEAQDAKQAQEDADANAAKQAEFEELIASGDGKLGDEDFDNAISEYQKALDLGVDDPTANAKIQEAQDAKQAQEDADASAAKQAEFEELIASGDDKLGDEDFDNAISEYQKALDLGVDNATANAKIKEAQDAKQAKENDDADAARQAEFEELIASGDDKLDDEDFDNAISEYQKALDLGVDDPTANAKIKDAQEAKVAYEADLAAKDEETQKQAKFDQFISAGDGKLGDNDFDAAISEYQSALDLDVNNSLAEQKIEEAEEAKAAYEEDLASQEAAALQAKFEKYISSGDGHLSAQAYDMAINEYQSALDLDVDNPLAEQKVQEARDAKKAYEEQMLSDSEDQEFNDLIAKGDVAKEGRSWEEAKQFYAEANKVKGNSPIPQQKIDEVNALMEAETLADQQAQLLKYLEKGKEITEAGEYDKAIGLYTKAQGLFPGETVLGDRINEVKELIAKQDEFNQFIADGDTKLGNEDFDKAISTYKEALNLNVDNATADAKIKEAEEAKLAKANADDAAGLLAEQKAAYDALMAKGKSEKNAEKYQEAIATYTEAKDLMSSETEPQQRIDEINDILANLADNNALLEKYQAALAIADAKRDDAISAESQDLAEEAKKLYDKAYDIKSDEDYPQEQVNRLSNLMAQWKSVDDDLQYQKIIDKADELYYAKEYDGAETLYNRAIDLGLKPGDPYPPAQLEKIKNARASAGKLDAYNEFVQEGNLLFQEKKYTKAIEAYEGALGVKATAKYPKDKIKEIKGLMSDMALAEKDKQEKENAIVSDPTYLGEEVSMTEEEINRLWADARVDEVTDKDQAYDSYKEEKTTENVDDIGYQTDRTESINEDYDQMDSDKDDLNALWDEQRKDVLPEIEDLKEDKSAELADYYDIERSRSLELNDYYNDEEQDRVEYELSLDDGRKDNLEDMEDYKFDQSEMYVDLAEEERDMTYENNEYYSDAEIERSEYELGLDDQRKDNLEDMEDYKFDQSEMYVDLAEEERDVTYENNEYYSDSEIEREETNIELDERREDNIEDMVDYQEDQTDFNRDLVDQGVSTTYEVYEDYEQMASEFEQFAEDGDVRRKEETVAEMDDYEDLQEDLKRSNNEENVNKTDKINEYNEDYHDYLEEFAADMDVPREENVSAMDVYQNDLSDDYFDDMQTNEERSQENYLDKDKVKEAQGTLMKDESIMVENNTKDMENYKDLKADQGDALSTGSSDVGYNNSLAMDSVKEQKATMFSDENKDPLANQYPEGITEKTFQRTNNLGEVVEVTIVRIVVRGNKADEYRKVTSKWNTAFFKNGGIINEYIWDTETN